jgi:hypothetical protein
MDEHSLEKMDLGMYYGLLVNYLGAGFTPSVGVGLAL